MPQRLPTAAWIVAALLMVAHLATLGRYGIFRDEFYYLANGRHLAWGYVDHPPLVAGLAWLVEHTIGTSVYALRAPMLLALLAVLAVIAGLVRRLGGGEGAVTIAWVAFALSPYYLYTFHYLSMNAPEVLWWSLAVLLLMRATGPRAAAEDEPPAAEAVGPTAAIANAAWPWVAFGVVMGLAALTKVSGLVWGAGLALGLLLSPARRHLRSPWPWAAVAIATVFFLPHVWWQVANDWPTAEFVRNAQATKIVPLAPGTFLREQLSLLGPIGALTALIGFAGLVTRLRHGRGLAVAVVFVLIVLLAQRSKAYYAMPAYPVLLAAGGVVLERWAPWRWWWGRLALACLLVFGVLLVPVTLPVLPEGWLPGYLARLGLTVESGERHRTGPLPQHFADMFGWETLADDVARVVAMLTADERATARIYTQNYGEAGALEYYGPSRGLPPVISGHNAYWHWGPGPDTGGGVLIIVGGRAVDHREVFLDVAERGRTTCTLCMPYEQALPIFVARGLRIPLSEIWPAVKHFD
ncbi:ArnT family glycosyltransferase [Luteitalea sp.]